VKSPDELVSVGVVQLPSTQVVEVCPEAWLSSKKPPPGVHVIMAQVWVSPSVSALNSSIVG
jgi:hypothetical protein